VDPFILRPAAKINLRLRVGPRRADGFHDLQTVYQSIAISDAMRFVPTRGPLQLRLKSVDPSVPADRNNLIWRAAERLWMAAGKRGDPQGAAITLSKRIPVAAGLGGGSADAAAALVGLNRLWKTRLPMRELLSVAAQLGSDVPFFLVAGTALGLGRGEEVYPLPDMKMTNIVIVKPRASVSTADAYRWFDEEHSATPAIAGSADEIDTGWGTGPLALYNDLQAPVTKRTPEVAEAIEWLRREGMTPLMSGSGSAVFAACDAADRSRLARRVPRRNWQVVATRTLSRRQACRLIGLC
jgi:4-diphosphocytidyl-2-C-methyl-D-erythritol kinase